MSTYDPFAQYYEADFAGYLDDVPFYRQMAQRTGSPILELMCGTGRVLIPLAEDGHSLTGVDLSPAMLDIARAKIDGAHLADRVSLVQDDVRSVDLPGGYFSLAFVAVNSFMHLDRVKDQIATLTIARKALERKGLLVIDLFNPDPLQLLKEDSRLILERSYELNGCTVQKFVIVESDFAGQVSYVTYLYDSTDPTGALTRRTMRFTMRWFYRYELEHLLARAGFAVRSVYGSYELDEYTSGSPRLIVVASPQK